MTPKHVFISYDWNQQDVALLVDADLKKRGYTTWMDIERETEIGNSYTPALWDAVANAFVTIVVVSSSYKESATCMRELLFAEELKVPILAIVPNKTVVPTGWLKRILAGKSCFDVSDFDGLAKKIWSFADTVSKVKSGTKERLETKELVEWVVQQTAFSDSDPLAVDRFHHLSEDLADEEARIKYDKEALPALAQLIKTSSRDGNPRICKSILQCFLHYALDKSQAFALRALLNDEVRAAIAKIPLVADSSEQWRATAAVALDLQYLMGVGAVDSIKKRLFISYSWGNKVLANKMASYLRTHTAQSWDIFMDIATTDGYSSLMERMSSVVATCSVVLVLATPQYEISSICKYELLCAKKWNKHIVFALTDPAYADGMAWTSIVMREDQSTCYDLSDESKFDAKMLEIIRGELSQHDHIKKKFGHQVVAANVITPGSAVEQPTTIHAPAKSVNFMAVHMVETEVLEWLIASGFDQDSEVYSIIEAEKLSGISLRALASMSVLDIKTLLSIGKIGDVLKLKGALDTLFYG